MANLYLRLSRRISVSLLKLSLSIVCTVFSLSNAHAQPSNDDPCTPTVAVLDGSCLNGTTNNALPDVVDPACSGSFIASVWYEITLAPGSDELTIDLTNSNIPAASLMITNLYTFNPDCTGVLSIFPGASYCGAPDNLNFLLTGLTGGSTFYFQVGSSQLITGDFVVCFAESGPPPCPSPGVDCPSAELINPTPQCVEGCNTGAPSAPTGTGDCFDFPNETSWYYFGAIPPGGGAPFRFNISVTSTDLSDPQVAIFLDCPALVPLVCETGTGGSVDLVFNSGDFPSGLYYVAISDAAGNSGEFELCIEPFPYMDCNTDSNIEVIGTSLGSPFTGPFLPTEEVEMCFNINNFNSGSGTGCNFLHGIKPTFGEGWDYSASFASNGMPLNITTPITNNSGVGTWQWVFGFDVPTYNLPNGPYPQGAFTGIGWYYTRNPDPMCNVPSCSIGDGIDPAFCSNNNGASWQVCFILTVKPYPLCSEPPEPPFFWDNDDLSVTLETFGDSETGSNPNPGCWEDGIWTADFMVNCCAPPILVQPPPQTFCQSGTAFFPLTSDLDPGVNYTWTVSPNSVGATACNSGCPNEINQLLTNNSPVSETVTYTVTPVASATGCVGAQMTYEVTVNARPELTIVPPFPICPGACANINTIVTGGQSSYNYQWTGGLFGSGPTACPNDSTMYYLTVTDANFCSAEDSVLVVVSPPPIPEITTTPDVTEICENDPLYPIQLTGSVTNDNGSFYLYNWGSHGSGLQTIEAEVSDFYMLTVTDALTNCSGETFIGITVHPAPVATIETPDPICGGLNSFCLVGAPGGGTWESDDVSIDGVGCINPSAESQGIKNVCYTYLDNFTMCDSTICIDINITAFPVLTNPGDTTVCDDFTLPAIEGLFLTGSESYFDAPNGLGTMYAPGDIIASNQQLYIFSDDGTGLCGDEVSFSVTIDSGPVVDDLIDVENCGSYTLPSITGTNLTGNEAFYDMPGGMGNSYSIGDAIDASTLLYIYDVNNQCSDEQSFQIDINQQPDLDVFQNVEACNEYTLQAITGNNLTGNEAYFEQSGANGVSYNPGDVINSSTTLYVYDDVNNGNCSDEVTLEISIFEEPDVDPQNDVMACEQYTLTSISGTSLTGNEAYFDQSGGNGNQYNSGDVISSDITLYIFDETGLSGCSDEETFDIEIIPEPEIDPISNVTACDEYTLANITGANLTGLEAYFDQPNGNGNQYDSGDIITSDLTLYAYAPTVLGGCFDEVEFSIVINETPTSSFTFPATICETDFATIAYNGNASPLANYTWNFNGGTIISGSGAGPYEIEWNNSGTYTIGLTVEQDNCTSNLFEETITVDPELSPPVINCNPTTNSIEFTWANVVDADNYTVTVLNGPAGIQLGNTYTFSGLTPGQVIEIQVEASGNSICGNSIATLECTAQNCPPVIINIDPVADICHDFTNPPINIIANVTGSDGSGTGTWSGAFISSAGVFDVIAAGPGNHVVTYTFEEAGCSYFNSITINSSSTPFSAFSLNDEICVGSTDIITYQDNASINATYDWDFGTATVISGSGQGPYEISWPTAGFHDVSLQVTENGCTSNITIETVNVFPTIEVPVINCTSSANEIVFTWDDIIGSSGYIINVLSGPGGIPNGNMYTVSGLVANEMVTIEVIAINPGLCPNTSAIQTCSASDCAPITINIDPVNDICLDANNVPVNLNAIVTGSNGTGTSSWSPSSIVDPITLGAGIHTFVYTFDESGCTYDASIDVEVFETPVAGFMMLPVICQGESTTITFDGTASIDATYNWTFNGGTIVSGSDSGPYEVSWASPGTFNVTLQVIDNNCNSNIFTSPINVNQPLALPVISCNSTAEQIEFSWDNNPDASGYDVVVISGASGIQIGNTYTVTGLQANEMVTIEVTAIDNGPCGNSSSTQTCSALDCPPVTIDIDPVNSICLDANNPPVNLNATVLGSNGTGTGSWSPSAIVDPSTLGAGTHLFVYTYEEVGCTFNESIQIEIFQSPIADFMATPVICQDENALVSFNGIASSGAVFSWDFDGGTIESGSGVGPYEISWGAQGNYNITLEITDNNCVSNFISYPVQVDQQLAIPVINCNSSAEQIEFSWNDVPGASGYDVVVISGANGVLVGNTYTVTGLQANDMVSIQVIALNNGPCGNSSSIQTCSALDCPPVTITIDPVNDICLDGNNSAINLNATVLGSNGTGTGSWSPSAILDPTALGAGTHLFVYTYEEVGCTFNESIQVEIFQSPIADFMVTPETCQGDNVLISFNGNASSDAVFSWDFDGGTIESGNGAGPYEVSWAAPGNYTISLDITDNNCISNTISYSIQVDQLLAEPVINCNSSTEQIEFSWNDVPGASGYDVIVISGATGVLSGNTYTVSGLQANDMVSIEVIAFSNGSCPNSIATQSCSALDCPVISVDIDPVAPICLDENAAAFNLNALVTGSDGSGSGFWSPSAIVDPVDLGPGTHTFIYTFEEVSCTYLGSIQIIVNGLPISEAGNTDELSCTVETLELNGLGSSTGMDINLLWTGPGAILNNQSLTPTIELPGIYYLNVSNSITGCSSIDSVEITQDGAVPLANAGPDSSLTCNFTSIQLQGSGSVGADFQYVWQGPGINGTNVNQINPLIDVAGTYILTVNDVNNGCSSFADTVVISDNTTGPVAVVFPVGASNLDCNNLSLILDATGSTTNDVVYQWLDSNNDPIPGATDIEYEVSIAGIYTILVSNTISGCFSTASFEIINTTAFPFADAGLNQQLDCTINDVSLDGSASENGVDISYLWTGPAGGISGNNTTPIISATLPGIYELTVLNNSNGCASIATVQVTEDLNGPVSDAGIDVELDCDFTAINLSGANSSSGQNYSYEWFGPDGTLVGSSTILNTNELGLYAFAVTDNNNDCVDTSYVAVLENSNVPNAANLNISMPSCYGENDGFIQIDTVLGGTMPYIYSLDQSNYTTLNQISNLESGQYTLTVQDAAGCEWDTLFNVDSPTEVNLDLGDDLFIQLGDSVDIQAVNTVAANFLDTIIWSPAQYLECLDSECLSVETNLIQTTTFNATISDQNGCNDSDEVTVYVRWDDLIYIPTVFTPNDDGFNDLFLVNGGIGIKKINHFRIFSRWGELVFERNDFQPNDPSFAWDGTFRGKALSPAVFVYYVEVELDNGNIEQLAGDVSLVK